MKNLVFLITFSISFLFQNSCFAQDIKALKGSYGIDETYKLIVWHSPSLREYENKEFRSFNFGEEYVLSKASKLNYEDQYNVSNNGKTYTLFITRLPLIHLDVDTDKLTNRKKFEVYSDIEMAMTTLKLLLELDTAGICRYRLLKNHLI